MNTLTTLATHYDGGPGPWWPIFPIFWLLFFIAVFAFFATRRRRWHDCGGGPSSGRSRLAERFAAGEIDEEEYRTRLAVLDENRGGRRR